MCKRKTMNIILPKPQYRVSLNLKFDQGIYTKFQQLSKERKIDVSKLIAIFATAALEEYTKPKAQSAQSQPSAIKPAKEPNKYDPAKYRELTLEEKKQKKLEYARLYYAQHKEKLLAQQKEYDKRKLKAPTISPQQPENDVTKGNAVIVHPDSPPPPPDFSEPEKKGLKFVPEKIQDDYQAREQKENEAIKEKVVVCGNVNCIRLRKYLKGMGVIYKGTEYCSKRCLEDVLNVPVETNRVPEIAEML